MPDLILHDVDNQIVEALKTRASANGHSAEAEVREILTAALKSPRARTFASMLTAIPEAGRDEDFARLQSDKAAPGVFD